MSKYIKPTSPKKSKTKQPIKTEKSDGKKNITNNDKKGVTKHKVYKSQKINPIKGVSLKEVVVRKNDTPKKRKHPEFGTSKLEEKFASKFLDKLGVKYVCQYKAESIGRFFDFYLPDNNILIEIDGGYWHSDPRLFEGKELTPTQKRNKRVDKDKNKWAIEHKIPLLRFWEDDINKRPKEVMDDLIKHINEYTEKYNKEIIKKERPKRDE